MAVQFCESAKTIGLDSKRVNCRKWELHLHKAAINIRKYTLAG